MTTEIQWQQLEAKIKALQVGDTICDCRYRHLRIVEIVNDYTPHPSLYRFFWRLPDCILSVLEGIWPQQLYDRELQLEDGSWCSAMHCIDFVPHDWEHPEEYQDA